MVKILGPTIDGLVRMYVRADTFNVVDAASETLSRELYNRLGAPEINLLNAWSIWEAMVLIHESA